MIIKKHKNIGKRVKTKHGLGIIKQLEIIDTSKMYGVKHDVYPFEHYRQINEKVYNFLHKDEILYFLFEDVEFIK